MEKEEDKQNSDNLKITSTSPISNARRHSSTSQPLTELDAPRVKERKPPNCLVLAPPVPKRTFQGKIFKSSEKEVGSNQRAPVPTANQASKNTKTQSKSVSDVENESCFDDIGDSDDLVIFNKKNQLIDPNQSSSDSNRSQTTIDTGYISAFDADRSSTTNQRQFRGRFSSEDTQSSLDSYLSSDLQRADTIESLQSNFTDSPFILRKNVNVFNFDQSRLSKKISSSGSIDSDYNRSITPIKTHAMRRLPAVPARKGIRQRTPPAPPLRKSQLAESSKRIMKIDLFCGKLI